MCFGSFSLSACILNPSKKLNLCWIECLVAVTSWRGSILRQPQHCFVRRKCPNSGDPLATLCIVRLAQKLNSDILFQKRTRWRSTKLAGILNPLWCNTLRTLFIFFAGDWSARWLHILTWIEEQRWSAIFHITESPMRWMGSKQKQWVREILLDLDP